MGNKKFRLVSGKKGSEKDIRVLGKRDPKRPLLRFKDPLEWVNARIRILNVLVDTRGARGTGWRSERITLYIWRCALLAERESNIHMPLEPDLAGKYYFMNFFMKRLADSPEDDAYGLISRYVEWELARPWRGLGTVEQAKIYAALFLLANLWDAMLLSDANITPEEFLDMYTESVKVRGQTVFFSISYVDAVGRFSGILQVNPDGSVTPLENLVTNFRAYAKAIPKI